ncbi:hypothetical protein OOJ74_07540 [Venenivibrio stagnispumantis]|nr:hypothetical protein [Venenivibrio stagnispumantis]
MKKYLSIFLFLITIFYISFGLEGSTKGFPKKVCNYIYCSRPFSKSYNY